MNDPNTLRHHYRKSSQTIARRKLSRKALDWLILWALVFGLCALICRK